MYCHLYAECGHFSFMDPRTNRRLSFHVDAHRINTTSNDNQLLLNGSKLPRQSAGQFELAFALMDRAKESLHKLKPVDETL